MSKKAESSGGVSIKGHVTVGGDIVGGDKTVYGDEVKIVHPGERVRDQGPTAWQASKDFVLRMTPADGGRYRVEAQGPTGEASTTFELPVNDQDLEVFLLSVGRPRGTATRGRIPEPVQETIDFGRRLYDAVISGAVRDTFVRARHDAAQHGYSLRLKLRLRNVSSIVRQLWSGYREHILAPWAVDSVDSPGSTPAHTIHSPYDGDGLLIHTSVGSDGGLGSPRTNRSGCAA